MVVCQYRLSGSWVKNLDLSDVLGESMVIARKLSYSRAQGRYTLTGRFMWSVLGCVEFIARRGVVALQLPAPNPAKVDVDGTIVIGECCGIDGEAFGNVRGVGFEGSFGAVGHGDTQAEDA